MKREVVIILSLEGHQFPDNRVWTRSHDVNQVRAESATVACTDFLKDKGEKNGTLACALAPEKAL